MFSYRKYKIFLKNDGEKMNMIRVNEVEHESYLNRMKYSWEMGREQK